MSEQGLRGVWRWGISQLLWKPRLANLGRRSRVYKPLLISGGRYISIGDGTLIREFARLEVCRRPGELWTPSLRIGNRVNIEQGVHVICQCSVIIEDEVSVAPFCGIFDTGHPNDPPDIGVKIGERLTQEFSPVRIGRGTLVGMHVVILPNVTIGAGCVIGAGSVVTRDVPDYCVAVGVPARVVRQFDCVQRKWFRPESNSPR